MRASILNAAGFENPLLHEGLEDNSYETLKTTNSTTTRSNRRLYELVKDAPTSERKDTAMAYCEGCIAACDLAPKMINGRRQKLLRWKNLKLLQQQKRNLRRSSKHKRTTRKEKLQQLGNS